MEETIRKKIDSDTTGLVTYEYLCNNIGACDCDLPYLVDNIIKIDADGQFTVSAARYLHAIDGNCYGEAVDRLIAAAIGKDRDRKYIGGLLQCIWGDDYQERAEQLKNESDNFRRIYKRVYPTGI